jgi:starch synthase
VPYYFMYSWPFFNEPYFYTDLNWDRQRYIFFSQAALGFVDELSLGQHDEETWLPDIIHVNDWHTGLIPFLLYLNADQSPWTDIATVLTIHNMAYQGPLSGSFLDQEAIPARDHPALLATGQADNLLGIGIAYADKINTVSPQHAIELHYPRFGEGLEGLIGARDDDFSGILNGIDMDSYNPATDRALFHNFTPQNFRTERIHNKTALQQHLDLPVREDVPVVGIISRFVEQKGLDFGLDALRRLCVDTDLQIIALGTGETNLELEVWQLGSDFPQKVRAMTYFDPILARRIDAASDLVLIPSRYEPCGITQMMGMRYGALPVVRETGGLMDTVVNYDNGAADTGTGFRFLWESAEAVVGTMRWAIDTYRNKRRAFERMQERAMQLDWDWEISARQYDVVYQAALDSKRRA